MLSLSHMGLAGIISQALAVISKLAPLSVVIGALALLQSFRQSKIKRDHDEAVSVREIFNKLGVKAYVLNWSMVGNSSVAAGVLQVREAIEERVGKNPSTEDLASFLSDRLLFEAVVEKGWRDSKVTKEFQTEALDFGKLAADLGGRVPLVQAALQVIDTRLRLMFMLNTFVVFSIRNDQSYKKIGEIHPTAHAMNELHRLLFRASMVPEKGSFLEACKFLQEFSRVAANADDKTIVDLAHYRRSYAQRFRDWLADKKNRRRKDSERQALRQALKDKTLSEFPLLDLALDKIFKMTDGKFVGAGTMQQNCSWILKTCEANPGIEDLRDAAEKFIAKFMNSEMEELNSLSALLHIRSQGVDDPDIDLFVGSATGITKLAESAINRGANLTTTLPEVLSRYPEYLARTQLDRNVEV